MRQKYFVRVASICMAILMAFTPITASAALLRRGSRGNEVKELQMTLKELGYFTYPKQLVISAVSQKRRKEVSEGSNWLRMVLLEKN